MDSAVHQKLMSADCDKGWECPKNDWKNHDWAVYQLEITAIQKNIRSQLNIEFARDGNVQDASYYDELFIWSPDAVRIGDMSVHLLEIGIRFSNFGKLYTIHSTLASNVQKYDIDALQKIVDKYGWTFVPAFELDSPYDGIHQGFKESNASWWIRFFDYI